MSMDIDKREYQKPKLQALCLRSLKRTYDVFRANQTPDDDFETQRLKVAAKVFSEYESVKDMPTVQPGTETTTTDAVITDAVEEPKNNSIKIMGVHDFPSAPGSFMIIITIIQYFL
jgi:hypothetical protein